MKKFFITTATVALFAMSAFAADGTKSAGKINVSYTVVNQFNADFAGAQNITWTVDNSFQKADFVLNGVKSTAFYNLQGDFVALTMEVSTKAIPAPALAEIEGKYKGFDINEVIVIQNNTQLNPDADETAYFVDLKNGSKELLTRITPDLHIELYKQIK